MNKRKLPLDFSNPLAIIKRPKAPLASYCTKAFQSLPKEIGVVIIRLLIALEHEATMKSPGNVPSDGYLWGLSHQSYRAIWCNFVIKKEKETVEYRRQECCFGCNAPTSCRKWPHKARVDYVGMWMGQSAKYTKGGKIYCYISTSMFKAAGVMEKACLLALI